MKKLLLIAAMLLNAVVLFSQNQGTFKYQTIARDASGNILPNQAINFRISILQGINQTNIVYSETISDTTNNFGLSSIEVGNGTVLSGSFQSIDWTIEDTYIKLECDFTGGTNFAEMGTSKLLSVPRANYASVAGAVTNHNDGDTSAVNEIQQLSLTGNQLSISGGNSINLSQYNDNTDSQQISISGNQLSITGGNSVTLPTDNDNQQLNLSSNQLSISGGNSVALPSDNDNQQLNLSGNQLSISGGNSINLSQYNDNTDSQQISISGNQLSITGGNSVTLPASSDNQQLNLSGNQLSITNGNLVQLPSYTNSDGDANYIPKFSSPSDLINSILYENNNKIGVGTINPSGRMQIQADSTAAASEPIFEIKDKFGKSVMVVYQDSVHFYVGDPSNKAQTKGSFAVSGKNDSKGLTNHFLLLNPDSTRIFTTDTLAGFGIKNIGSAQTVGYLKLTPSNYFIGHEAGSSITRGKFNSFIGYQAGKKDSTGKYNIFIGHQSGYNTGGGMEGSSHYLGSYNIFLGYQAGFSNTQGWYNTATGYQSMYSNIFGSSNAAYGYMSLFSNTSGQHNTAIGNTALKLNTTGIGNSAFGADALFNNIDGTQNVACGQNSLNKNIHGWYNTAIGSYSLYSIEGSNNTGIGYECGYYAPGSGNVFIGYMSGFYESGNNKLYIANSYTNDPLIYGDFDNSYVKLNNKLGVGRVPSANAMETEGDASKTTAGAWLANSDKRIKTEITDIDNSFETILKLRPVKFKYTNEWKKKHASIEDKFYYNFIAQEYQQVFPDAVKGSGEYLTNDSQEVLQIDTYNAQIVTIKAVQDLINELNAIKEENKNLKLQNQNLKAEQNNLVLEINKIKTFIGLTKK